MGGMSRLVLRLGEATNPESFDYSTAIGCLFILKSLRLVLIAKSIDVTNSDL